MAVRTEIWGAAALATAALLGGCATPGVDPTAPVEAVASAQAEAEVEVAATVTRDGETWTLDYALDRDVPVWGFMRSSLIHGTREPWRPTDWTVLTPGVVLERVGHYDVLRTLDGSPVPRQVRLRMVPEARNLEADYGVLAFTDGSVALFTGAFDVFPLSSLDQARDLPQDLNGAEIVSSNASITWRDTSGPVLIHGQRQSDPVTQDGTAYVLFGQAQMRESAALVTVIDQQLPGWIGSEIETFAPRIAGYYTDRLGAGQTDRPTIMASWMGPKPGVQNMGGSVLPGLIVMAFEGEGNLDPTPASLAQNRWFIGHESAHFWLGQTLRYRRRADSWITEGGADLMAIRGLKTLYPDYDVRTELQGEVDDCIRLATRSVSDAGSRGEHRAYYACGAVFALAAEGLQARKDGGDWFDWLKGLIDANREEGVVTAAEWLDHLDAAGGSAALRGQIEALLSDGSADPKAAVATILRETGVAHHLDGDRVVLE